MAKCTFCNSRKGKRKCRITETFICSLCCGENREQEKCNECSFFKPASVNRNYRSLPRYSTEKMSASPELENISRIIETTLCRIWVEDSVNMNDRTATRLVELLLDKYHFNDDPQSINDPPLANGYQLFSQTIEAELHHIPSEKLVKVLGAVYRSIGRRTVGGSSYLKFVSRFTGVDSLY